MGDEEGRASEPDGAALGTAPTVDDGPGWQAAKRSIHQALFPDVEATPTTVGRFELLRRLGQGGMGEVFVAYDDQLDRQVAIKLLLRERSADDHARERLVREAQVLARLSHPNVVQIYEAGVHEGQVYLVMELVDGITLREWMEQVPEGTKARPWSEVVPVMTEAGRGLAAAHAVGLTHRDFKPDNVLVGSDGRVRVLDFGLARPGAEEDVSVAEPTVEGSMPQADGPSSRISAKGSSSGTGSGSRRGIAQLTEPGRVMGTLAYMSPEQLAATPLDARSDQYSFCVALYEALYGERPFSGRSYAAYLMAVTHGHFEEPAGLRSQVPRWLRALVQRGLSVAPEERFADMDALLRELSRAHGRTWKLGLAAGALVLGGAGLSVALGPTEPRPCTFDQSALEGTWDEARRDALRATFAASGAPTEGETFVERSLTEWSDAWLDGLRSACEATRIAGTQSEAMLDLRSSCLERQRREAGAIVEQLTSPDGLGADHALELLGQLPDSGVCDDPRLAETSQPLPADPARREAVLATYEQLGRVRALAATAHLDEADALAETQLATAETLDYLPLTIEARALMAGRSLWRQRIDEAVPLLRSVIREAEIAHLDELSATLKTSLARNVAGMWGQRELQAMVLEDAETAVARLGRPHDQRELELGLARASWLEDGGDYEAALTSHEECIERTRAAGELRLLGMAQLRMAHLLVQLRRFEDAERAYADFHATFERDMGPSPSTDAELELHLGLLELARERLDTAQARFTTARERYGSRQDPKSDGLNQLELAEAKLALFRGDDERARQGFAHVIDNGVNDRLRAEAWEALGVIRFYQHDMPGSLDAYRSARALYLATLGPNHPSLGILESNIGESTAASGDHQGALQSYAKALDVLERALPPDHANLAFPYKGRGQSRYALGDRTGARSDLERALALHQANPGEPLERADVETILARVLFEEGEPARALELARVAHQHLVDLGQAEKAAEISSWLDEHS